VDFANVYADIAVGGLGSPDGYTTTLIRTIGGKRVFTDAVRRGYIEERRGEGRGKGHDAERAERARILGLIETAAEKKRSRGEKRLSQLKA
jgi:coenzyme F420-reducing hydrogenase beta subunit